MQLSSGAFKGRQVCRHLERLYQHTVRLSSSPFRSSERQVSNETAGAAQIAALLAQGWALVEASWPVIASALAPRAPPLSELLHGTEGLGESRCHGTVKALLRQQHVRLLAGVEEAESMDFVARLESLREAEGLVMPEAGGDWRTCILGIFRYTLSMFKGPIAFPYRCGRRDKSCVT